MGTPARPSLWGRTPRRLTSWLLTRRSVPATPSVALEALAAKLVHPTAQHVRKEHPEYEKVG